MHEDLIASYTLFHCCRKGDLEQIRLLTEQKEVNLNIRDAWDSTPLYYACLCGHQAVVEYLLAQGARCDASTFDGERCLYGALTNDIKKLLRNFKVISTGVKRREVYQEFLRRLLSDGALCDVTFNVHGNCQHVHRCILAARSKYFDELFHGKWRGRQEISINNSLVDSDAFRRILEWIYTGEVQIDINLVAEFQLLARQCQLEGLERELENAAIKADYFVHSKRGAAIRIIQLESQASEVESALGALAQRGLPEHLKDAWWAELPMPPEEQRGSTYTQDHDAAFVDLIFSVQSCTFHCHKAIFWSRSDYFRALLDDHFGEGVTDAETGVLTVPVHGVAPDVFAAIVTHVYSNTQQLSPEIVSDVLVAADMFLLPGLKRQCGNYLSTFLDADNVVDLIRTARMFDLPRLQQLAVEFIANNIDVVVSLPSFHALVREDAQGVKDRQDTDTIDIIDEIRFHVKSNLQSLSAIGEAEAKLERLDQLLEVLELDA